MKTQVKTLGLFCILLSLLMASSTQAQTTNLNCGAESTNFYARLSFLNGSTFDVNSGYVHPLPYTLVSNLFQLRGPVSNIIKGYYFTSNLVVGAVSTVTNPASGAAIGSYLACQIVSVTGPAGGAFQFWEQGSRFPTYSYPAGQTFGGTTNLILISDITRGAGLPDGDPFGKIPGRRYTVDKPGDYVVGFRLVDTSKNSPLLTATHIPSDILYIKFSTRFDLGMSFGITPRYITNVVNNVTNLVLSTNITTFVLKQGGLSNYVLQASTTLQPGSWVTVLGPLNNPPPLGGTRTFSITNSVANTPPVVFYRAFGVSPP